MHDTIGCEVNWVLELTYELREMHWLNLLIKLSG